MSNNSKMMQEEISEDLVNLDEDIYDIHEEIYDINEEIEEIKDELQETKRVLIEAIEKQTETNKRIESNESREKNVFLILVVILAYGIMKMIFNEDVH